MQRILLLGLLVLTGCEAQNSVTGTVLCNGKELERGHITFFPLDGSADTRGSAIADGSYMVQNITPGKKRVLIRPEPRVEVSKAPGTKKPTVRLLPHETRGNDQEVEITTGRTVLNF